MWESIEIFLESVFAGPMWPASVLLGLLLCYLMLAILGAADLSLDGPDVDLPDAPDISAGPDIGGSSSLDGGDLIGLGAVTMRWLNLGQIPAILWLGTFTIVFWCVSWLIWTFIDDQSSSLLITLLLIGRNIVISVAVTKFATNPMLGWFADTSRYHPGTLIGRHCEISTGEATPSFGQARFRTNAAPLLLNVHTDGGNLKKGDRARITAFDPERRIYTVTKADLEVHS